MAAADEHRAVAAGLWAGEMDRWGTPGVVEAGDMVAVGVQLAEVVVNWAFVRHSPLARQRTLLIAPDLAALRRIAASRPVYFLVVTAFDMGYCLPAGSSYSLSVIEALMA